MKIRSAIHPALQRRLFAAGCPTVIEVSTEPQPDIRVDVSRPEVTVAYDMRAGTEYVFGLRVTNCSWSRLKIERYRARFEWMANLYWLGDPRVNSPQKKVYRLESGLEFPCQDVLNHRVGDQGLIEPGKSIEGVLLAYTMFEPIPPEYIHGDEALATLSVTDQHGRHHRSPIEFSINRRATMPAWVFRSKSTRRSLFEETELKGSPATTLPDNHAGNRRNV